MKLKKLKPHAAFYKTLHNLAEPYQNGLFISLSCMLVIPQIYGTTKYTEQAKRFIAYKPKTDNITELVTAILTHLYDSIILDKTNDDQVAEIMYNAFIDAYKSSKLTETILRSYLLSEEQDTFDPSEDVPYNAWGFIHAILNNDVELFKLVYAKEVYGDIVYQLSEAGKHYAHASTWDDKYMQTVNEYISEIYKDTDGLLSSFDATLVDDKVIIAYNTFLSLVRLTDAYLSNKAELKAYTEYLNSIEDAHRQEIRAMRSIIKAQQEKIEQLKQSITTKTERIYVDNSEQYEIAINELQAEIESLKKEKEVLEELLSNITEKSTESLKEQPFEYPVEIDYIGKYRVDLEERLKAYNVFPVFHNPFDEHITLSGERIVVYNTNYTSHKVYYRIKEYMPILVSSKHIDTLITEIISKVRKKLKHINNA